MSKQKMSRRERKQKVEELVEKINSKQFEYASAGLEVPCYKVCSIKSKHMFWCSFLLAIILSICGAIRIQQNYLWAGANILIVALVLFVVCCIAFKHCVLGWGGIESTEVSYSYSDTEYLDAEIARMHDAMEEYHDELKNLDPLIRKFERLSPIIEEELGGRIGFDKRHKRFYVRIEIGDKIIHDKINNTTYADTVRIIIAAREDKKLIQEFEASLTNS